MGSLGLFVVGAPSVAGAQDSTDDPAKLDAGEAIYGAACSGCHGADGTGTVTGRSLVGIGAQEADRSVHIASVTNGKGGMPAFADELSADEIDAAVTYVRLEFSGGSAIDDLPRTGSSSLLLVVGGSFLATGVALADLSRRHRMAS
ncbi:MAG: cytochrome c [Acidimicrobiales bacterium]